MFSFNPAFKFHSSASKWSPRLHLLPDLWLVKLLCDLFHLLECLDDTGFLLSSIHAEQSCHCFFVDIGECVLVFGFEEAQVAGLAALTACGIFYLSGTCPPHW